MGEHMSTARIYCALLMLQMQMRPELKKWQRTSFSTCLAIDLQVASTAFSLGNNRRVRVTQMTNFIHISSFEDTPGRITAETPQFACNRYSELNLS